VIGESSTEDLNSVKRKLVNGEVLIDRAFALDGVKAYYPEEKSKKTYIDPGKINVTIAEVNSNEYYITYEIIKDGKAAVTANSTVTVDSEAPVFSGITDFKMESGEIPSDNYLLKGVTVSDNYTKPENIKVSVSIKIQPDGTNMVIYSAIDEAGNKAVEQASIFN
jgi:hypothetical protein